MNFDLTERAFIKDAEKENVREPGGNQAKAPWDNAESCSRPRGTVRENTGRDCQNKSATSTAGCWLQGFCSSEGHTSSITTTIIVTTSTITTTNLAIVLFWACSPNYDKLQLFHTLLYICENSDCGKLVSHSSCLASSRSFDMGGPEGISCDAILFLLLQLVPTESKPSFSECLIFFTKLLEIVGQTSLKLTYQVKFFWSAFGN